jgi:hypothetical protein
MSIEEGLGCTVDHGLPRCLLIQADIPKLHLINTSKFHNDSSIRVIRT